jgi:hypothetical protein
VECINTKPIFFNARVNWLAKVIASASLEPDTVARLMASFRKGDSEAAGRLVELFYPELRRIAAARMRTERMDHTLQPTAVVNQLYLELVKVKALRPASSDGPEEKTAFLGLAAFLMKRLLIHHARPLSKRQRKQSYPTCQPTIRPLNILRSKSTMF